MGYELIQEDGSKKVVRFTMDASDLGKIFRKVKREISKEALIPGFRPGHIPESILQKKFGNLIIAEVAEQAHRSLTEDFFDNFDWVLSDEDPEFENLLPVEGEDYIYTVTYKVFEAPEPVDYREVKVTVPAFDLDKAVNDTIDNIRTQFVEFEPTEDASAEGDMVILSYPAPDNSEDKEPRDISAVIGRNDMGPGFDELVTGVRAGDSFTLQMQMQNTKEGVETPSVPAHKFTVKEVRSHTYPELDDEFAKKAGGFDDMDKFREKVREDLSERHAAEMKSYKERLAVNAILENNQFDVPAFMVSNLKNDYLTRLEADQKDEAAVKAAEEMAESKVREFLLLRQIAIAESLEIPEQEIAEAVAGGDSRSAFLDRKRNEKALEFVLNNAIVEEKHPEEPSEGHGDTSAYPWKWVRVETEAAEEGER
ncbi:trigger factor [Candidatus Fermentibacteria bacterium]|nr:MAG: trigger factor [Candidatus Fermentibacteria bacterium]